ncbi:conserved hypothetical protein [Leptothrix cholodnii SP-6]|uniref:Cytoplasmic protein n=1 Tax=Leptothrix cholodnii (strain ATCC 51168 / LMG 8142 / SP-6) TaxID=395495 RepID=B1Y6S2_LEPCP|nr:crosslink repair DNA glycosylase YcaQ family protein [Leptothrix cholodnii]ACB32400.1 conserved hypothetical protein [Leptothrix cholodnii SP-6]
MTLRLEQLRRHALARSLFAPTTLPAALQRLGFVQADPLRAPAKAQDLTLRHRVRDYRAGELEQRYPRLGVEEDFFVNYGFVPRRVQALLQPRQARRAWDDDRWQQARAVQDFVRQRGVAHPREVDAQFDHGTVGNWFGGRSRASTELLDGMHYRGLLRVARREGGTRLYAVREATPEAADPLLALDTLTDLLLQTYAPLPAPSLSQLLGLLLGGGVPQWRHLRAATLQRAQARWPGAEVDGLRWHWPVGEDPARSRRHSPERVCLLAPFDPVVWDRRRFEIFWGWAYRFEAYVPAARRQRGHYALPLLWRDQVIGWANVKVQAGRLMPDMGYVDKRPAEVAFGQALDEELDRLHHFLGLG